MKKDVVEIKQMLHSKILDLCQDLLPGGKLHGHRYVVGGVHGNAGKSMNVDVSGKPGLWIDFATGDGGDVFDLIGAVKNLSFVDSISWASDWLGVNEEKNFTRLGGDKRLSSPPEIKKIQDRRNEVKNFFLSRGISPDIVDKAKIFRNGDAIVFPYYDVAGEKVLLYKFRGLKEKKFWSNKSPNAVLFGWQFFTGNERAVVITEGEIDQLSYAQQGIFALSIPSGAGNRTCEWIENEYNNLAGFEKIYISMDMDDPGQSAVAEIAKRLGYHRCYVVDLGRYKDANDAIRDGFSLDAALRDAESISPNNVRPITDSVSKGIKLLELGEENIPGYLLPWPKTQSKFKVRPGEVTLWAGINSHGKSMVVFQQMVHAISCKERFFVASMEMPPEISGSLLARQAGYRSSADTDKILSFFHGVWEYSRYGSASVKELLEIMPYMVKRYGVGNFIIDSLANCGLDEDDYNSQKSFVDSIVTFAKEFKVHVHLVSHVRKKKSEDDPPGKLDVKGTGALTDMVDNVVICWRNKKENRQCDSIISFVKQRFNGKEFAVMLNYYDSRRSLFEQGQQPIIYI